MTRRPIRKLLVANRGEIAARISRTAQSLGISTVAVFSEPDARALHVRACDEAIRIGGSTAAESYLQADAIVDGALRAGADAVHPGYGFLAENAEFAQKVSAAGLVWVGPSPAAIQVMGDKIQAKRTMAAAGVPLVPGADIADEATDEELADTADAVGYPLMVKAAAGGGGRGMRTVDQPADLLAAVAAARREATAAFGDGRLFLERYLVSSRHIEVQIIADAHGNVVHLFERECSIQRRHQKVIEEAPSPALSEALRGAMGSTAVEAARAIDYEGAGTVEFIAADDGDGITDFYFLEMNTRLQVEHPVTELITGLDLVALQLSVAQGDPLPFTQAGVGWRGSAIEARLYAEDPYDYTPSPGPVQALELSTTSHVRYDLGVAAGDVVSPYYDPMLGKIIAWGETRAVASARLAQALKGLLIVGLTTNRDLLAAILEDEGFLAGRTTTAFLHERTILPAASARLDDLGSSVRQAVTAAAFWDLGVRTAEAIVPTVPPGFSTVFLEDTVAAFVVLEAQVDVRYRVRRDRRFDVIVGEHPPAVVEVVNRQGPAITLEIDGHRFTARVARYDRHWQVAVPGVVFDLVEVPRFPSVGRRAERPDDVTPVPGAVAAVLVGPGDHVTAGQALVVIEAMKMEHSIVAHRPGTIVEVLVDVGQQLAAGERVLTIEADEE